MKPFTFYLYIVFLYSCSFLMAVPSCIFYNYVCILVLQRSVVYFSDIIFIEWLELEYFESCFTIVLIVLSYSNHLWLFLYIIIFLLCIILTVAYFTLLERKVMASMQRRVGPNIVGLYGILQPFADAFKLIVKEFVFPRFSDKYLFISASYITFFISLAIWSFIPLSTRGAIIWLDNSLLLILTLSSLGVYGILIAGWSSNSKYALLGSIRALVQFLSYEVVMSLLLVPVIFYTGSVDIYAIINHQLALWNIIGLCPIAFIYFICLLAETNRAPFDLPEAEAELVAGYNVEYSSLSFAYFFLGEYTNMLTLSYIYVHLFLGGWYMPYLCESNSSIFDQFICLSLKVFLILFLIIWVRATLPRMRYDKVMQLLWKNLLGISILLVAVIISFTVTMLVFFNTIDDTVIIYTKVRDEGYNIMAVLMETIW